MKRQINKIMISSAISLVMVSLLSVGVAFAWFPSLFNIGNITHRPGDIDNDANYSYWNKASSNTNKWTTVSSESPITLNLGEMIRIDRLPAGTENYFRFSFNEVADIEYYYQVILETIEIIVDGNAGVVTYPTVNYYTANPSQKVYEYFYYISTTGDLDPTSIFASPETFTNHQVTTLDQNIVGDFVDEGNFLYIMFNLRLLEIQNIIDVVPVSISPYSLEFAFTFLIEKRTIDEL